MLSDMHRKAENLIEEKVSNKLNIYCERVEVSMIFPTLFTYTLVAFALRVRFRLGFVFVSRSRRRILQ